MTANGRQRKNLQLAMKYQASLLGPNLSSASVFASFSNCVRSYAQQNDLNLQVIQCGAL